MFDPFFRKYESYSVIEKLDPVVVDKYKAYAPDALVYFWQQYGIGVYMNGYLKLVNPALYTEWVDEHIETVKSNAFIFALTAFADVIYWDNNCANIYNMRYAKHNVLSTDIELLFNRLIIDDYYHKEYLKDSLYERAKAKLGEPLFDECYGYFPALALGGRETLKNLQKVKLNEHLEFLAQLVGKI